MWRLQTQARLVCDPSLDAHVIDVEVIGPGGFKVITQRINPAAPGMMVVCAWLRGWVFINEGQRMLWYVTVLIKARMQM